MTTTRKMLRLSNLLSLLLLAAGCSSGHGGNQPMPGTGGGYSTGGSSSGGGYSTGGSSSGGSGAYSGSGGGSGGVSGTKQVCVYYHSSYTSGCVSDHSESWKCDSNATDLASCKKSHQSDSDYVSGCKFSDYYSAFQMLDGPCSSALAVVKGGGSGTGGSGTGGSGTGGSGSGGSGSGGGTSTNCPSDCTDVCLGAGYTGFSGECSGTTCYCTNDCGSCGDACMNAGYTGFSGQCSQTQCACSNNCGECDSVCASAGQTFSGWCTDTACYCK